MNRFMLFAFSDYYPSGGMGDLYGTYATREEAILAVRDEHLAERYENLYVIDRHTLEKVWDIDPIAPTVPVPTPAVPGSG